MRVSPSRLRAPLGIACAALALVGCEVRSDPAPAEQPDGAAPAPAGSVLRDAAAPAQPPVEPMAVTVIQSQPGPEGSQVDLMTVKVTGDVLTVALRCSSDQRINPESFRVDQISAIDDASAQRLGVLKDESGNWLASRVSGDILSVGCEARPGVLWMKFPAPPSTSKTVSINIPEVAPFDGVPVAR